MKLTEEMIDEKARQIRRERHNAWNRAHPDRVRQHQKNYYRRQALKELADAGVYDVADEVNEGD